MALHVMRCGRDAIHEDRFVEDSRIYMSRTDVQFDPRECRDDVELARRIAESFINPEPRKIAARTGMVRRFTSGIHTGDLVIVPTKRRTIHVGRVTGGMMYDSSRPQYYQIWYPVQWVRNDIGIDALAEDMRASLGGISTLFSIARNNLEERFINFLASGSETMEPAAATSARDTLPVAMHQPAAILAEVPQSQESVDLPEASQVDVEKEALDRIGALIEERFHGHGLTTLVDAILRAQGYQTLQSPAGPDGGVDILAAPGDMGFGQPRLCVQVKSGVQVCGSPILRDLIGTMQTHRAENGLLVSWSSWTKDADRLLKSHFFTVRAWDRNILIEELLKVYDRLDIIIRSELPLRQVWIPVTEDNS